MWNDKLFAALCRLTAKVCLFADRCLLAAAPSGSAPLEFVHRIVDPQKRSQLVKNGHG
jgi:hypothetical protein